MYNVLYLLLSIDLAK